MANPDSRNSSSFFFGKKTYISGSTFGEDGQVYGEEEEEDQGGEVG